MHSRHWQSGQLIKSNQQQFIQRLEHEATGVVFAELGGFLFLEHAEGFAGEAKGVNLRWLIHKSCCQLLEFGQERYHVSRNRSRWQSLGNLVTRAAKSAFHMWSAIAAAEVVALIEYFLASRIKQAG